MKPAPFTYLRPDSLLEAVQALAQNANETRVLAGGQSLMAVLNMRLASPAQLLDVSRLKPLRQISLTNKVLKVGACVTQAELLGYPNLGATTPLLAQALVHVGHPQTRNRGTVGGSLAHADPSAELPLCLALLNAKVHMQSASAKRVLEASAFQTGMLQTALASDEILTAIEWPLAEKSARFGFDEFSLRRGDFAIIAVAMMVTPTQVRVGIGGLRDAPAVYHFPARLSESARLDALEELAEQLPLQSDSHATAKFRRRLVRSMGLKIWRQLEDDPSKDQSNA